MLAPNSIFPRLSVRECYDRTCKKNPTSIVLLSLGISRGNYLYGQWEAITIVGIPGRAIYGSSYTKLPIQ